MISEVDVKDWIRTEQPKKLYDLPRNTVVEVPGLDDLILFSHIDGMYSFCKMFTGEYKGEVVHLAAWTEVHPWTRIS